jgi:hypothetical protein
LSTASRKSSSDTPFAIGSPNPIGSFDRLQYPVLDC